MKELARKKKKEEKRQQRREASAAKRDQPEDAPVDDGSEVEPE